jgi:hypothetical protein
MNGEIAGTKGLDAFNMRPMSLFISGGQVAKYGPDAPRRKVDGAFVTVA